MYLHAIGGACIHTNIFTTISLEMLCGPDGELPEKLRNLEPRLIEHISNEIMDKDPNVRWDDIGWYTLPFSSSEFLCLLCN
jgi:hypothetical protein